MGCHNTCLVSDPRLQEPGDEMVIRRFTMGRRPTAGPLQGRPRVYTQARWRLIVQRLDSQSDRFRCRIRRLENQNQRLMRKKEALEAENQKLKTNILELEELIHDLEIELENCSTEYKDVHMPAGPPSDDSKDDDAIIGTLGPTSFRVVSSSS